VYEVEINEKFDFSIEGGVCHLVRYAKSY